MFWLDDISGKKDWIIIMVQVMELVIFKVFMKDQWVSANTTKLALKEE